MDRTRIPGTWYQIRLRVKAAGEDDAVALASVLACCGVIVRPAGRARIGVEAWFEDQQAAETCLDLWRRMEGAETESGGPRVAVDEGWLEQCLTPRAPLAVGPFLLIDGVRPTDRPRDDRLLEVCIPRGRAFGTGEHETTRLCLELLGEAHLTDRRVLDLGTGSAVLAIAAARRGARVLALDKDPAVLEVAEENVALNGVAARVEVAAGSWGRAAGAGPFDLVVANIHRSACVRAARGLSGQVAAGGSVVLSGFLVDDGPRVAAAWQAAGFEGSELRTAGEWCALRLWRTE